MKGLALVDRRSSDARIVASKRRSFESWAGALFILPWLLGILAFRAFPLGMSAYLSFTEYNIISPPFFTGLENFRRMVSDPVFLQSAKVTIVFVLLTVPTRMAFALFIAYLLSSKLRSITLFRAIYYIPSLMGGSVAIAITWRYMFLRSGLVNQALSFFGLPALTWLAEPITAMFVISVLQVWQFGSGMVIFLAGLKNVPTALLDAATVDGASRMRTFWSIVLPYITPVIFFNLLINLVRAFQEFNAPYVITQGGPFRSTHLLSLTIYQNAFTYLRMGYSSLISWVMFAGIAVVTIAIFATADKWVHYSD